MKFIRPSVKLEALTLPAHMRDGKVASYAVNLFNEVVPGSTESVIELAGRTCYKSEDKITESSSSNFCKMIQTRNHACYDDKTEVLTSKGFKFFKDLNEEDLIASFDPISRSLVDFEPLVLHVFNYNGSMLSLENKDISLNVTPNHRLYTSLSSTTFLRTHPNFKCIAGDTALIRNKNSKLLYQVPQRFCKVANPAINPSNDATKELLIQNNSEFFKFIGFFIGDGSIKNNYKNSVLFHLKKDRKIKYLKTLCQNLNFDIKEIANHTFIVTFPNLKYWCKTYLVKNGEKYIPDFILKESKTNIANLIDGLYNSDGYYSSRDNNFCFSNTSKDVIDKLQILLAFIGIASSIRFLNLKRKAPAHKCAYEITEKPRHSFPHINDARNKDSFIKKTNYNGNVYCCTVSTGLLMVRRNNKIILCGNSVIEHCSATFRIIASRDILQEIVRHRLASYSVESTRYCTYSEDKKGMQFVLPYWVNEQDIKNWESPDLKLESKGSLEFILTCKDAEQRYNALIKEGFKPQEARSILPGCLKTEVVMTANFREWQHFLELRTSPAAHPDMRIVANLIANELAIISPILFEKYTQA